MGQKVHPHGARVGVISNWDSRWYADKKNLSDYIVEDRAIRRFLKEKLYDAGISKIEIERRDVGRITIAIHAGKPGMIIGKGGSGIEALKAELVKKFGYQVNLDIIEIRNIDTDAQLVAESIASQLERRISFRRAMKQTIARAMKNGAKGIKTQVSGRLGGLDLIAGDPAGVGSHQAVLAVGDEVTAQGFTGQAATGLFSMLDTLGHQH